MRNLFHTISTKPHSCQKKTFCSIKRTLSLYQQFHLDTENLNFSNSLSLFLHIDLFKYLFLHYILHRKYTDIKLN